MSIFGDVAASYDGSDNPDPSFMRGFMWSLVLSLTLWAAAISLAFSVFG